MARGKRLLRLPRTGRWTRAKARARMSSCPPSRTRARVRRHSRPPETGPTRARPRAKTEFHLPRTRGRPRARARRWDSPLLTDCRTRACPRARMGFRLPRPRAKARSWTGPTRARGRSPTSPTRARPRARARRAYSRLPRTRGTRARPWGRARRLESHPLRTGPTGRASARAARARRARMARAQRKAKSPVSRSPSQRPWPWHLPGHRQWQSSRMRAKPRPTATLRPSSGRTGSQAERATPMPRRAVLRSRKPR
mmetsp:Transcript_67858/g.209809  ORF Transcript_67858/g.209809 Transcript_67858/m.209809 type:complete len:254 (+) Transcript_67858:105-866(+)